MVRHRKITCTGVKIWGHNFLLLKPMSHDRLILTFDVVGKSEPDLVTLFVGTCFAYLFSQLSSCQCSLSQYIINVVGVCESFFPLISSEKQEKAFIVITV